MSEFVDIAKYEEDLAKLNSVIKEAGEKAKLNNQTVLDKLKNEMDYEQLKSDQKEIIEKYQKAQAEIAKMKKAQEELEKELAETKHSFSERRSNAPKFAGVEKVFDIARFNNTKRKNEDLHLAHRVNDDLFILGNLCKFAKIKNNSGGRATHGDVIDFYVKWFTNHEGVNPDELYKNLTGKAITTSGASGTALFPTQFSRTLLNDINVELRVANLFELIEMDQSPFVLPFWEDMDLAKYYTENAQHTETESVVDTDITLTARRISKVIGVTDEARLGAIINMMENVRRKVALAHAQAIEQSIINGQYSGTLDSGIDSNDVRKAYDGIRYAQVGNKTASDPWIDGSLLTESKFTDVRKAMGVYGVPNAGADNLAWIVSPSVYNQMLDFDEVQTVDKYGLMATIVTGELARFKGIPVIVSQYVAENLNASGVYSGSDEGKTIAILVHRSGFLRGRHGTITVEEEREAKYGRTDVVVAQRAAFTKAFPSASDIVGQIYNIPA
jgi:HK97 family phage major capsid protein